jgi:hypothetical protein
MGTINAVGDVNGHLWALDISGTLPAVSTPAARPAPLWLPLSLVAVGTVGFGWLSSANAGALSPTWGQDLAFFSQIVHRAATGGPWASPLLLEPQGFFAMVHTHLILPLVVGTYAVVGRQEVLLFFQAAFASLALWPAYRMGEMAAGRAGGLLAAAGLMAFGPFQAVAIADFRPSALFLPGILGMYAAARTGRPLQAVGWAVVANLGRQEGAWLAGVVGGSLLLLPWGLRPRKPDEPVIAWLRSGHRWRTGLALALFGTAALAFWAWSKPAFLFHLNPLNPAPTADLAPDIAQGRWTWLFRLLRSGGIFGLLAPTPLAGALPIFREMARTGREWGPLSGPAAHYGAFWVPFVMAAGIAGAGRLRRWWGLAMFAGLSAAAFPWVDRRTGPAELLRLVEQVTPNERVAASYDVISALAQRDVVWNSAWLSMTEDDRPYGWTDTWPIPLDAVDTLVIQADDPLLERALANGWAVFDQQDDHRLVRRQ